MGVRVTFEVLVQISENTQELKELGKTPPYKGTCDLLDDGGTWRQRIVAGAVNVAVDLNGLVNGRLLAVKTNQTITMKKNASGGEPWTIRPMGTGALDGVFLATTDGITSLYFSNPGSLDAEVTISLCGMVA
jgi:hypothetical protein